jgi:uncharacterized membrane protein
MRRFPHLASRIWNSFWFLPTIVGLAGIGLALGMIQVDTLVSRKFLLHWQLLFGAGADGSRSMLSAVATSIITIATVTFSITMLALSQTSSQYSPRVLRNFLRDRTTQIALGVFLGVFAYCIVVLRTISGGDHYTFVPSISVTVGGLLALVALGFLVLFIHHIATSLEASSVMAAVFHRTSQAVDNIFPEPIHVGEDGLEPEEPMLPPEPTGCAIRAKGAGFLASIDTRRLVHDAVRHSGVIRAEFAVGEFVAAGQTIARLEAYGKIPPETCNSLADGFNVERHRSIYQDPAFGIQQLADIALKALSPGVNDPTTAITSIQYVASILHRLSERNLGPRRYSGKDGRVRLEIPGPSFAQFTDMCFGPLRAATKDRNVLVEIAGWAGKIGKHTRCASRKRDLTKLLRQLERTTGAIQEPDDRRAVEDAIRGAFAALDAT